MNSADGSETNAEPARPRAGGIKIVFDVPEQDVGHIARRVAAAGFDVHRYYHPDDEHRPGGSKPGQIRLGAQRPISKFTAAEQNRVVAAFDSVQREAGFTCERIGVDSWRTGGSDPPVGDREPRAPLPPTDIGSAFAERD